MNMAEHKNGLVHFKSGQKIHIDYIEKIDGEFGIRVEDGMHLWYNEKGEVQGGWLDTLDIVSISSCSFVEAQKIFIEEGCKAGCRNNPCVTPLDWYNIKAKN